MEIKSFYPKTIYQLTPEEYKECKNSIAIVRECPNVQHPNRYMVMENYHPEGVFYKEDYAYKFCEFIKEKYESWVLQ